MQIEGLVFVGTRTAARSEMVGFVEGVLGLDRAIVSGMEADLFDLPDGSTFAVTSAPDRPGDERTIGFLVRDLDAAAAELRGTGAEVDDEVAVNDRYRYLHFRAPDGQLYELVEERTVGTAGATMPA